LRRLPLSRIIFCQSSDKYSTPARAQQGDAWVWSCTGGARIQAQQAGRGVVVGGPLHPCGHLGTNPRSRKRA
jgi:hypothetical protein